MAMRILILGLVVACSGRDATPAAGSGSAVAVTAPLTEPEARGLATRLARAAFEANPRLRAVPHAFEDSAWTVEHAGGRWKLDNAPPDGAYAHVRFGEHGEDPQAGIGLTTNAGNAGSARDVPTPDPITKPLSEDEVRREATRLARAAFEANPSIKDAAGAHLKTPAYEASRWIVKHEGSTWKLDIDPPGGAYAHVKLGAFGDHPEVDVGFATE